MELSQVLKRGAEVTLGHRWLWPPALLFTLALDLPSLLARPFVPSISDLTSLEAAEPYILLAGEITSNIPQLVVILLILSVGFGALWALATVGQAVLIDGVAAVYRGAEKEKLVHWKKGRSLLGPFIAIDTLAFFPIFIVLLLILLILGGISASLLLTLQRGGPFTMSPAVGLGGSLLIPLVCLILPAGILGVVYRLIAFRFAALNGAGVRQAVGQVRPFLRQHFVNVLLLLLLTGVIYYLINGVVIAFGGGMRWLVQASWPLTLKIGVEAIVICISLVISLFRNLFLSACWTIAMVELDADKG